MRVDHYGCYTVTQAKLAIFFNCKFYILLPPTLTGSLWVSALELSLEKDKSQQLPSTLMTGQTRTNSHQNLNQFKVNESL